jgi:hypothetical protein
MKNPSISLIDDQVFLGLLMNDSFYFRVELTGDLYSCTVRPSEITRFQIEVFELLNELHLNEIINADKKS